MDVQAEVFNNKPWWDLIDLLTGAQELYSCPSLRLDFSGLNAVCEDSRQAVLVYVPKLMILVIWCVPSLCKISSWFYKEAEPQFDLSFALKEKVRAGSGNEPSQDPHPWTSFGEENEHCSFKGWLLSLKKQIEPFCRSIAIIVENYVKLRMLKLLPAHRRFALKLLYFRFKPLKVLCVVKCGLCSNSW